MADQPRRFRSLDPSGYTLAELLIVIALWSLIGLFITLTLNRWLITNSAEVRRMEEERRLVESLDRFSRDAHEAIAVLEASPERTIFWSRDTDSNAQPGSSEIVEYRWSRGNDWTRSAPEGEIRLGRLHEIVIGTDTAPPGTRHIVIEIAYPVGHDIKHLGTSVALRAGPFQSASPR